MDLFSRPGPVQFLADQTGQRVKTDLRSTILSDLELTCSLELLYPRTTLCFCTHFVLHVCLIVTNPDVLRINSQNTCCLPHTQVAVLFNFFVNLDHEICLNFHTYCFLSWIPAYTSKFNTHLAPDNSPKAGLDLFIIKFIH